jgi:molybdenum cofactor cytidylyltransferase
MSAGTPGVILLAAGKSSRMGRAKQLLPWRDSTLLRHAAETALATGGSPVVVVLGAEAEACRPVLGGLAIHIVINAEWEQGMGTSIRAGVAELTRLAPASEGALIMLHDQPYVTAARLLELVAARMPDDLAVASLYEDAMGVPAFFTRELFGDLQALDGRAGAQGILKAHAAQVQKFAMPEARHDIDTPGDYERLKQEIEDFNMKTGSR